MLNDKKLYLTTMLLSIIVCVIDNFYFCNKLFKNARNNLV